MQETLTGASVATSGFFKIQNWSSLPLEFGEKGENIAEKLLPLSCCLKLPLQCIFILIASSWQEHSNADVIPLGEMQGETVKDFG